MTERHLEPMKRRSIHCLQTDYERARELSLKYGMTISAIIRLALQVGLDALPGHFKTLATARRKTLQPTVKATIEHLQTLTPGAGKPVGEILPGKVVDYE